METRFTFKQIFGFNLYIAFKNNPLKREINFIYNIKLSSSYFKLKLYTIFCW